MSDVAIGIDLGTSNSVVSVVIDGQAHPIADAHGEVIVPSVVHFSREGKVVVGREAKRMLLLHPESTIFAFKRLLGRYFYTDEIRKARTVLPYTLVEGPNREVRVQVHGRTYPIPEIAAYVLAELRNMAEAFLGRPVTKAVITVPANYNDNQRQATKDACQIAGLETLKIINEPTAVALAYGFDKRYRQRIAVYDLGGGTFDITVLDIDNDVFEVCSTDGEPFLGGDDFDGRVMDHLAHEFELSHGIDLRSDRVAMQALKEHAEWAKMQLSEFDRVGIEIRNVVDGTDLNAVLTDKQLAQMTMDLVQRTFNVCDSALRAASSTVNDIDGVVLCGGQSKSRFIRSAVEAYFNKRVKYEIDPDLAVALGAAIHADQLLYRRGSAVLIDVTSLSLRVATVSGYSEVVIPRNTPLPVEQSRHFVTAADQQETVRIRIYQGEAKQIEENELLGEFGFTGFRRARRGEVEFRVTFVVDSSGLVRVEAIDPETGRAARTTISLRQHLSEEEKARLTQAPR